MKLSEFYSHIKESFTHFCSLWTTIMFVQAIDEVCSGTRKMTSGKETLILFSGYFICSALASLYKMKK